MQPDSCQWIYAKMILRDFILIRKLGIQEYFSIHFFLNILILSTLKYQSFGDMHKLRWQARGGGFAKCLCYYINLYSKLVYGGGRGCQKSSKSCQRSFLKIVPLKIKVVLLHTSFRQLVSRSIDRQSSWGNCKHDFFEFVSPCIFKEPLYLENKTKDH